MRPKFLLLLIIMSFMLVSCQKNDGNENTTKLIHVGTYQCKVTNCHWNQHGQDECQDASGVLKFIQLTDSLQIEVSFEDYSHYVLSKGNDSTYTHNGNPYISVLFHSKDSVSLSIIHSQVGYSKFKGKRTTN